MMLPLYTQKTRSVFQQLTVLSRSELYRNWLLYLLPLPVMFGIIIYRSVTGSSLNLPVFGIWLTLGMIGLLALVYGLQCFSNETDRQTLDFLISRPLSPYIIVSVKYVLSCFALLFWLLIASFLIRLDFSLLPLPKGMGPEWIVLFILVIHAMSFLAGITAKGFERLFVVVVASGSISWLSYQYWNKIFNLITANFYWPDIPNRLMLVTTTILPYLLTVLGLAIPITGTIWYLRSRMRWWEFKPFYWLSGSWLSLYGLICLAEFLFSPPIPPMDSVNYGDWHEQTGIVLCQTVANKPNVKKTAQLFYMKYGGKPKPIYRGRDIQKPKFSPNGQQLIFIEDGIVKSYTFASGQVTSLTSGTASAWSNDGRSIIVAKPNGNDEKALLYTYNLTNKHLQPISGQPFSITELAWDSQREVVVIFGKLTELTRFDLKTQTAEKLSFPKLDEPSIFKVVHPSIVTLPKDNSLLFGQVFDRTVKIYHVPLTPGKPSLLEEKTDVRILTGPPVLINNQGVSYIWPRFDGGFETQISYYQMGKLEAEHHHDDHDGHDHDD